METNWNGNRVGDVKYETEETLSINEFKIKYSTEYTHLIAFKKGNSSRGVFAKVSRKVA